MVKRAWLLRNPYCSSAEGDAAARHVVGMQSPCLWPPRSWVHGSQLPRSVLSRERLLVFRGETGLGGLLRLELLEAVECLGESESSPS